MRSGSIQFLPRSINSTSVTLVSHQKTFSGIHIVCSIVMVNPLQCLCFMTVVMLSGFAECFIPRRIFTQKANFQATLSKNFQATLSENVDTAKQWKNENDLSPDNDATECHPDCPINEECLKDTSNKEKCSCREGFASLNDVICAPCSKDCGTNGHCYFNEGQPDCKCLSGFVLNGANCQECICGENEECSFIEGKKECFCKEGYSKLNKSCIECICGENEECSFIEGKKECFCKEGYLKLGNSCIDCGCAIGVNEECFLDANEETGCRCRKNYALFYSACAECFCADENSECSFSDEGKTECKCLDGYIKIGEKCKECSCKDENSECSFNDDGKPECKCLDGYIEIGKKCEVIRDVTTTEDQRPNEITNCNCGVNEICELTEDRLHVCRCLPGFIKNEEKCQECKCDENEKCSFNKGKKSCSCKEGYLKINNTCTDCGCDTDLHEECFKNDSGKYSCRCKNGYAPLLNICVDCGCQDKENAVCFFDEDIVAICQCPDGYIKTEDICKATTTEETTLSTKETENTAEETTFFTETEKSTEEVIYSTKETEKTTEEVILSTKAAEKTTGETILSTETEKTTEETTLGTETEPGMTTSHTEIISSSTEPGMTTSHTEIISSSTAETGKVTSHTEITTFPEERGKTMSHTEIMTSAEIRTFSTKEEDVTTEVPDPCADLCARFACTPCKLNDTCEQADKNYRCMCIPNGSENCEEVACETKFCAEGNCTQFAMNPTTFVCSCNKFNASYSCQQDLNFAGADSNLVSIICGSVTVAALVILAIIFAGLKIKRRCRLPNDGYYIEDSTSTCSNSSCNYRIPAPREIPEIL